MSCRYCGCARYVDMEICLICENCNSFLLYEEYYDDYEFFLDNTYAY